MRKRHLTIIMFVLICVSGCKHCCDDFPEEYRAYMPYEDGDELIFADNRGNSFLLIVENCWKDDTPPCSNDNRTICEIWTVFNIVSNSEWDISFRGEMGFLDDNFVEFHYYINSDHQGLGKYIEKNDPLFGDTVILTVNNSIRFNELKIVKGLGLVEFYDKKHYEYWTRVLE